jgi:hypothetical protein
MDENQRKELYNFHLTNDALFRRLVMETASEPDESKFQVGLALLDLVMMGKVAILQDSFGELLFDLNQPN